MNHLSTLAGRLGRLRHEAGKLSVDGRLAAHRAKGGAR
jgi:hypothetical protein